jgi:Xaa-Pro aminopeptidase
MSAPPARACAPVSPAELARRWSAVRSLMRERAIDALVMQNSNDWLGGYVRWFAGIPATNAYPRSVVFPVDGDMSLVGQGPFGGVTRLDGKDPSFPGVGRLLFTPSYVSAGYTGAYDADLVIDEIKRGGFGSVGLVGPAAMYHGFGARLTSVLPGAGVRLTDATDFVDAVKSVKSAEEQALIRATAAMQDEVITRLRGHLRPGMKDFEVAAYAQYVGQLLGSEQGIFIGSSAPPGQAAVFRPRSQQGRELRAGDTLTILIENNGPGGFYTEVSRPIVLGKATQEQRDAWALVLEAQRHTLALLKPGTPCREIFEAHNGFMRSRGAPEERRLYCHGQGYDMVERPLVRQDESMAIAEHMNIVVHPVVTSERFFMTVVDNYLIGRDGPGECLHRTPKEIIEL